MSEEADFIVIGSGSAGAAVASRLSEDPSAKVVIVEAGGESSSWVHRIPAAVALLSPRKGSRNWGFETVPQPGLGGRLGYQPRGRVLGGTSAINGMVYIRGHRRDYDNWAARGNAGWDYESVLPYFKRSECNQRLGEPFHGQDGPVNVEDLRTDSRFTPYAAKAALESGFDLNPDFNGAEQEGLGHYQLTQKNGERCSSSRAYLEPHAGKRDNLRVITNAHVTRVEIEDGRAAGIEYWRDGKSDVLKARKEIVLAAGTFQSPQLLMLSGIGDPELLQRFAIPVVAVLPGVGKNLQDHIGFSMPFECQHPDLFGISVRGALRMIGHMARWRRHRRGALASNFSEFGGFIKTTPGLAVPDVQLHLAVAMIADHGRRMVYKHGYSAGMCCLRPKSRGTVTLGSSDPMVPPLIDPRFFDDQADIDTLVRGFKVVRTLMSQPSMRGLHIRETKTQGVTSDDEIRDFLRSNADSIYHPAGTCAMGREEEAVVDDRLRVHGIANLRVVDVSIMPTIVSGNTNAAGMMIGEKAADMIQKDWADARHG